MARGRCCRKVEHQRPFVLEVMLHHVHWRYCIDALDHVGWPCVNKYVTWLGTLARLCKCKGIHRQFGILLGYCPFVCEDSQTEMARSWYSWCSWLSMTVVLQDMIGHLHSSMNQHLKSLLVHRSCLHVYFVEKFMLVVNYGTCPVSCFRSLHQSDAGLVYFLLLPHAMRNDNDNTGVTPSS